MAKSSVADQLIKNLDKVENEALASAILKAQKEEIEAQEKKLLKQFRYISKVLTNQVKDLREYRKRASIKEKKVKSLSKAFDQWKKDGDYLKLIKTADEAGVYLSSDEDIPFNKSW